MNDGLCDSRTDGEGESWGLRTRATEGRKGKERKENGPLTSALRCDYLGNNRAIAVTVLMAFHGYE